MSKTPPKAVSKTPTFTLSLNLKSEDLNLREEGVHKKPLSKRRLAKPIFNEVRKMWVRTSSES
jgi:hypothetical protein